MRFAVRLVCLLMLVFATRSSGAQAPHDFALDATVGLAGGVGGRFGERVGPTGDLVASARLANRFRGAVVGAIAVSRKTVYNGSDICLLLAEGGCAREFPSFSSIGAMAGWEVGAPRRASARVLLGPTLLWESRRVTGGADARLDLATPAVGPVALVASARGTAIPRYDGASLGVWTLALGMRIR